jgi:2-polyprenyl-3-methyl-5-hydroxy-6-metoxy-1,4-benzoquinol methylase
MKKAIKPAQRQLARRMRRHCHAAPSVIEWEAQALDGVSDAGQVDCEPSALHTLRIAAVTDALGAAGARVIGDLGCGSGALLSRLLADARFERIVGVDIALAALTRAERMAPDSARGNGRLTVIHGSFLEHHLALHALDAIAMLETIEHVPPGRLSRLESLVFGNYRPRHVVITTPNVECNVLLGVPEGRHRETGHFFEWSRAKFEAWAAGTARRNAYEVRFSGIGECHPRLGSPTQMAKFTSRA